MAACPEEIKNAGLRKFGDLHFIRYVDILCHLRHRDAQLRQNSIYPAARDNRGLKPGDLPVSYGDRNSFLRKGYVLSRSMEFAKTRHWQIKFKGSSSPSGSKFRP